MLNRRRLIQIAASGAVCLAVPSALSQEVQEHALGLTQEMIFGWTKELVIEPGCMRPVVLFCAIGPGNFRVIYNSVSIDRCLDTEILAKEIRQKSGKTTFNRILMDSVNSRQKMMGYSVTVANVYEEALCNQCVLMDSGKVRITPVKTDLKHLSSPLTRSPRVREHEVFSIATWLSSNPKYVPECIVPG